MPFATKSTEHTYLLIIMLLTTAVCSCESPRARERGGTDGVAAVRVEALNGLRNAINAEYGYRDGAPRINLGPCGRFARDFREEWNRRFSDQVNIAFVMAKEGSQCHHVLTKLPDGNYFDGGNGVISEGALLRLYTNSRVEEMKVFDPALLDKRSYDLKRDYPECPNYSDAFTQRLIGKYLQRAR
jgi:hypothetical protein